MAKSKPNAGATMNRLTHERVGDITKTGYWTAAKKQELIDALAAYEDTGMTPDEISKLMTARRQGDNRLEVVRSIPDAFDRMADEYKTKLMVSSAEGSKVETIRSRAAAGVVGDFSRWLHNTFACAGLE